MILPDVNLFVYAYDASSPFHLLARSWCERVLTGPEPVVLLPAVLFGYVRIITHPKVFLHPLSITEARTHVDAWIARRHVRVVDMLSEDVTRALDLLQAAGTAGNLTTDAQLAAVAIRLNATVHTADLDFARFAGVRFLNPLRH